MTKIDTKENIETLFAEINSQAFKGLNVFIGINNVDTFTFSHLRFVLFLWHKCIDTRLYILAHSYFRKTLKHTERLFKFPWKSFMV